MSVSDRINSATRRIPAWPLYVLAILPPAWLLYSGLTGGLGVDPVKAMEHQMGIWGLQILIAGLFFSPLRVYARINLIRYRRAVGLIGFFYIFLHLLVWLVLDVQILSQIWADILKRPYITVGMIGFVLMIPLALTSNNWSVRKLGPAKWRRLHKLTYAVSIAGGLHYVMLVKGWQLEPLIYFGVICLSLATRLRSTLTFWRTSGA
ncbi:MAG: protein-methionine-sulfoxide reductase heme-binding subunit MsrQ [Pseudoruegeria sp.]